MENWEPLSFLDLSPKLIKVGIHIMLEDRLGVEYCASVPHSVNQMPFGNEHLIKTYPT